MLAFCFSTVFCSVNAYSQRLETPIKVYSPRLETPIRVAHPDFSGTWKLNPAKSGLPHVGRDDDTALIVVVEQKLPAIAVSIHFVEGDEDATFGKITFYTDGRGDEFPDDLGSNYSTTRWQDNKLVITVFSSKSRQEVSAITELELSPDGNTLMSRANQTKVRKGPNGERIKYIDYTNTESISFDRISGIPAKSARKFDLEDE